MATPNVSTPTMLRRDTPTLINALQEHWFCYWKISPALWPSRLAQLSASTGHRPVPLFIPLHWSHHVKLLNDGQQASKGKKNFAQDYTFEFGQQSAQGDLLQLEHLARQHHLNPILVLPLGPTPFLPNGGAPSWLATAMALGKNGLPITTCSEQGSLYKMASFVNPLMFREYSFFLQQLAHHLKTSGSAMEVMAGRYFIEDEQGDMQSIFWDYSPSAERALGQYLQREATARSRLDFYREMEALYLQVMGEHFSGHFIGARPMLAAFARGFSYLRGLEQLYQFSPEIVPSLWSAIKQVHQRPMILCPLLKDHWWQRLHAPYPPQVLPQVSSFKLAYDRDEDHREHLLRLVAVVTHQDQGDLLYQQWLRPLGLDRALERDVQGAWVHLTQLESQEWVEESSAPSDIVLMLSLPQMAQEEVFKQACAIKELLRLLMLGKQVILNEESLSGEQRAQLETFILENQLMVIQTEALTALSYVMVGEGGGLYLFKASQVKMLATAQQQKLWHRLWSLIELNRYPLALPPEVVALWTKRPSLSLDLEFSDLRRLYLSCAQGAAGPAQFQVQRVPHYYLQKMIPSPGVQYRPQAQAVEVMLPPGATLVLEFGYSELGQSGTAQF